MANNLNKKLHFVMSEHDPDKIRQAIIFQSPKLECDACLSREHCKNCKIEMALCCNCYEECGFNEKK